jgi:hypothetical protein
MAEPISDIFAAAAKVNNEWSMLACALVALLLLGLSSTRKGIQSKTGVIIVIIAILVSIVAAIPYFSRSYITTYGVYRLRVIAEDTKGLPINDAKLTSSIGGEPKRVEGGWEFDIPSSTKPKDGKLTVYATRESDFLSGRTEIQLLNDLNIVAIVLLKHDDSGRVSGRVVDQKGKPIAGVGVNVVGYEAQSVLTGALGQFDLPAHASDGQQVEIAAYKKSVGLVSELVLAGETPVTLVLRSN